MGKVYRLSFSPLLFKIVLKRPFYNTKPENLVQGSVSVRATGETKDCGKLRLSKAGEGAAL